MQITTNKNMSFRKIFKAYCSFFPLCLRENFRKYLTKTENLAIVQLQTFISYVNKKKITLYMFRKVILFLFRKNSILHDVHSMSIKMSIKSIHTAAASKAIILPL